MVFIQNWFVDSERTHEDRGATMVEYALIVTLIALAAIVGITTFGTHLSDFFDSLTSKF
jgi:Flp pilus assembly pilin Flp